MSGPPPPVSPTRREAILAAALRLFRQRGFHTVGIDEIGTSAGISGPGVYRHFPSKTSLLVALFDGLTERMLDGAGEIQKLDLPPEEMLDRLVGFHVAAAVAEPAVLAVWAQDAPSLPPADRARFGDRQAEYVGVWTATLAKVRPELGPDETQTVVHAALGAVNSVAGHDTGLAAGRLEALLAGAARAVLGRA
jgi:AcrR family transcriptional regulator